MATVIYMTKKMISEYNFFNCQKRKERRTLQTLLLNSKKSNLRFISLRSWSPAVSSTRLSERSGFWRSFPVILLAAESTPVVHHACASPQAAVLFSFCFCEIQHVQTVNWVKKLPVKFKSVKNQERSNVQSKSVWKSVNHTNCVKIRLLQIISIWLCR